MLPYFLIVAVVVGLDQLSKRMILGELHLYETREIIPGFFNLVHVTNTGAAFSFLADVESSWRHYFFVAIAVSAVILLTIGCYRYREEEPWLLPPFALIAAGAAGNLIDRLLYGHVIDFLDFSLAGYHWPAFNLADSSICIGAVLFIILNWKTNKLKR